MTYRTFKRSCRNWQQFVSARKMTENRGLSYESARQQCATFNANLTAAQKRHGTKMEFEAE
jgi:hypothetical protein